MTALAATVMTGEELTLYRAQRALDLWQRRRESLFAFHSGDARYAA